jgi:SAM-dependent methyltransferase
MVRSSKLYQVARAAYVYLWALPRTHRAYGRLSAAQAFSRIYSTNGWGAQVEEPYCSGTGSGGTAADQYCRFVSALIRERSIQSVVDLGCGDFRIGRRIVAETGVSYTGVDIVPELVSYYQRRFSSDHVRFECANIATDPLPGAQLCLLRQVLQHLSNAEILCVLTNVRQYSHVLISEHVPAHPRCFNRDKTHGPDIRAYFGSGVYPDREPFSQPADLVWETPLERDSLLRTVLLRY